MSEKNDRIKSITFFVLFVGITAVFLYIINDLLIPIFYGAVLAIAVYPLYIWIKNKFKGRTVAAAAVTSILSFVLIAAVVGLLGAFLARDAITLFETARDKIEVIAPQIENSEAFLQKYLPASVAEQASNIDLKSQITSTLRNITGSIFSSLQAITANIVTTIAFSLISIYSMVYLLMNGKKWMEHLAKIIPLPDEDEKTLATKFINTVRAALKLVFVMGAIQGFLGGLIFYLLGISAPVFWGFAFAIFSLIPGLGHPIIWLPAAIILFITGSLTKAIILVAFGMLVMGMVDDILRPFLLGRSENIHPFLILISTLGALSVFGFAGLILGPVVASLTIALWRLYEQRYT